MSVKDELASVVVAAPKARKAEVAVLLRCAGGLRSVGGRVVVDAEFDHRPTAERLVDALREAYGVPSALHEMRGRDGDGRYLVRVSSHAEDLARQTGLVDRGGRLVRGMPVQVVSGGRAEVEAAWRGAVLACGVLGSGGQRHGLVVDCPSPEAAMALVGAARRLGVAVHAREVRGRDCVVVRDEDAVSGLLQMIGAPDTAAAWTRERSRRRRAESSTAVRNVEFESANVRRAAVAAAAASARVKRALEILGDATPAHLAEAGRLRLEHPEAPLLELGRLADPPLSKDTVAGRIRRLLRMADRAARKAGVPDTGSAA